MNFFPNSISFTLPSRFSSSQGLPRGIALGTSLNHTKVLDDFGPVGAIEGDPGLSLSLEELDSAMPERSTEAPKVRSRNVILYYKL